MVYFFLASDALSVEVLIDNDNERQRLVYNRFFKTQIASNKARDVHTVPSHGTDFTYTQINGKRNLLVSTSASPRETILKLHQWES